METPRQVNVDTGRGFGLELRSQGRTSVRLKLRIKQKLYAGSFWNGKSTSRQLCSYLKEAEN